MNRLDDMAQVAQDRVRLAYETLQFRAPGEKLYVAYSGGKDSECIVQICREAVGVDAMEINYNATGIDPPELVRHIKRQFKAWRADGIECNFCKDVLLAGNTMHNLIVRKGPPTRLNRYCCEYFKEGGGPGRIVVTGVRWAESPRRAKNHGAITVTNKRKNKRELYNDDNDIRRRLMEPCPSSGRLTVNPIIDWSNNDVWSFIKGKGYAYCCLYDEGFHRLGCIGCPMASKMRYKEFARWPYMKRYYMRAFAAFLKRRPDVKESSLKWRTAEDMWHWWMEDGVLPGQMEIEMEAL